MSKDFGEFCAKVQYLINKLTCEHENVPVKVTNPIFLACGKVSYALSIECNEFDDANLMEAMVTVRWFDPYYGTNHEFAISAWDIDIVEWEVEKMKKEKDVRSAYPGLPREQLCAKTFSIYPNRIYYYDNDYTTVLWNDGTRTTVKLSDDDIYDEYSAFCAALAKRIYGSNSRIKKIIKTQGRTPLSKEDKKRRKEERKMRAEMEATQDLINDFAARFRDIFGSEEE